MSELNTESKAAVKKYLLTLFGPITLALSTAAGVFGFLLKDYTVLTAVSEAQNRYIESIGAVTKESYLAVAEAERASEIADNTVLEINRKLQDVKDIIELSDGNVGDVNALLNNDVFLKVLAQKVNDIRYQVWVDVTETMKPFNVNCDYLIRMTADRFELNYRPQKISKNSIIYNENMYDLEVWNANKSSPIITETDNHYKKEYSNIRYSPFPYSPKVRIMERC
jgi:hypothetical protein